MAGGAVDSFIDRDVLAYGERNPGGTASAVALEIDTVGPWLVVMDEIHHEIHEGEGWSHYLNTSAAAASGYLGVFRSSSATNMHFRLTGIDTSNAGTKIRLVETVTSDSGFSASAAMGVNRYRDSAATSCATLMTCSGAITASSILDQHYVGGGTGVGGTGVGGTSAEAEEFILKKATTYGIWYNSATADNNINVRMFWYNEAG